LHKIEHGKPPLDAGPERHEVPYAAMVKKRLIKLREKKKVKFHSLISFVIRLFGVYSCAVWAPLLDSMSSCNMGQSISIR
jgi:hypothetical protein